MVERVPGQPTRACLTRTAPEAELLLTPENSISMETHFQSSTL